MTTVRELVDCALLVVTQQVIKCPHHPDFPTFPGMGLELPRLVDAIDGVHLALAILSTAELTDAFRDLLTTNPTARLDTEVSIDLTGQPVIEVLKNIMFELLVEIVEADIQVFLEDRQETLAQELGLPDYSAYLKVMAILNRSYSSEEAIEAQSATAGTSDHVSPLHLHLVLDYCRSHGHKQED